MGRRSRQTPLGEPVTLKVAGGSNCSSVAGALVKYMQEKSRVSLMAIGAGAVNQMMKALAIARGMAGSSGVDLAFTVGFAEEMVDNEKKTAIRINVFERR